IFPYPQPQGQHGFAFPGGQTDDFLDRCDAAGIDRTECPVGFDVGNYMVGMFGAWFAGGGKQPFSLDMCQSRDDCPDRQPVPEERR
ncbi:MAG: hypothetical protein R3F60_20795, partial [bacterium]